MKRLITAITVALWGAAVMWAIDPRNPDQGMLVSAGLGAFLSGLAVAPLFLKNDWRWSAFGAFAATLGGAALGGASLSAFSLSPSPLQGAALGVAFVGAAIVQSPVVLAVWLGGAVAVGRLAHRLAGLSP